MLYPDVKQPFQEALFRRPGPEYRSAPFWAWNNALDEALLLRQVRLFADMGYGGYHIHARNGLATPYLGDAFMRLVRLCHDAGNKLGLKTWLYDEDRYPSGAAGGLVTSDPAFHGRFLLWTPYAYGKAPADYPKSTYRGSRQENGHWLGAWVVALNDSGHLKGYKRLAVASPEEADGELCVKGPEADGTHSRVWHAYLETTACGPWFNGQTYLDTLNPKAVRRFIEITHERYAAVLGGFFGQSVPGIFTDEPQTVGKGCLPFAHALRDVSMPWTGDFAATWQATYGEDILDCLPEIFWESADGLPSRRRWQYHEHAAERFVSAFSDTLGYWCEAHGIRLTGHLMSEASLLAQNGALGEAMRHYRSFQLPGIDILADQREWTTAKQAQSVARQKGSEGVLSEMYGVMNHDLDFRSLKLQGDWQAAMGVTVRVPHLTHASLADEAKRDYPPSFGYQSTWHRELPWLEDHFARLNTVLTRGQPVCRIAVVHPIESYWLRFGPQDQTGDLRQEMDSQFHELCRWLLLGLHDFDYLSESLLPEYCKVGDAPLPVGQMHYDVVIVSGSISLRRSTVERLLAFAEAGGQILIAGEPPTLMDVAPDAQIDRLKQMARQIPFTRSALHEALEPWRLIDARDSRGRRSDRLLVQMREDQMYRWLFLCQANRALQPDIHAAETWQVSLQGRWQARLMDTLTGAISAWPMELTDQSSRFAWESHAQDSLLLHLQPADSLDANVQSETNFRPQTDVQPAAQTSRLTDRIVTREEVSFPDAVPVRLSEPNVLLLDQAQYAYDDGNFQPADEILRIDANLRMQLGWPPRDGQLMQPWAETDSSSDSHMIHLRMTVESGIVVPAAWLAMERPDDAVIRWNGQTVKVATETADPATISDLLSVMKSGLSSDAQAVISQGWFVDEAIRIIALPEIRSGENILEISLPVTRRKGAEWVYILGDFGVQVRGSKVRITEPVRSLAFSDWTCQGLPFYAGNVTYLVDLDMKNSHILRTAHFHCPLLTAAVDGHRIGSIVIAPYELQLPASAGIHRLELTAFGHRFNAFGPLHMADVNRHFVSPDGWRTSGDDWSPEYRFRPAGLLSRPRLWRLTE